MDILTECERLQGELQAANDEFYKAERCKYFEHYDSTHPLETVHLKLGRKWHKLDIGTSGAYMVNIRTGMVHGIKGYGVPHPKVIHGRIDLITGAQLYPRRWTRAGTPPIPNA